MHFSERVKVLQKFYCPRRFITMNRLRMFLKMHTLPFYINAINMKFILGRKLNMTQIYDASGKAIPATAIEIRGNVVVQIRTKDTDGYEAVQVGEGTRNPNRIAKPQKGHFKDMGSFASVCDFRMDAPPLKVGDKK